MSSRGEFSGVAAHPVACGNERRRCGSRMSITDAPIARRGLLAAELATVDQLSGLAGSVVGVGAARWMPEEFAAAKRDASPVFHAAACALPGNAWKSCRGSGQTEASSNITRGVRRLRSVRLPGPSRCRTRCRSLFGGLKGPEAVGTAGSRSATLNGCGSAFRTRRGTARCGAPRVQAETGQDSTPEERLDGRPRLVCSMIWFVITDTEPTRRRWAGDQPAGRDQGQITVC